MAKIFPTEANDGYTTYVCPKCGKKVYVYGNPSIICDACDTEMEPDAGNDEDMTEYELSEDEAAALRMTLNECLDNATDAQLVAIHDYALSLAPIPQAENVDRDRVRALYDDISKVLIGIGDHKTPPLVAIAAYKTLGIGLDEELQARIGLVDYLNDCTATAYQTGSLKLLEDMHKVVTTVHDLIGDYDEDLTDAILKKHESTSEPSPWDDEPASDLGPDPWDN